MSDKIESAVPENERKVHKWYQWFDPNDTPEERKLLVKLDLLIVPYALLVWCECNIKYSPACPNSD